jgi:GNAT superfamily N-acetyltransferase
VIRPARLHELPLLSALALRSKAVWGYSPELMAAFHSELTLRAEHLPLVFVDELGGAVRGFYALSVLDAERAELEFLFVEPGALRRGCGRALLAHAREQARELGCRAIVIQGDPHAAGFYVAIGARAIGSRESDSVPGRVLPLYELSC